MTRALCSSSSSNSNSSSSNSNSSSSSNNNNNNPVILKPEKLCGRNFLHLYKQHHHHHQQEQQQQKQQQQQPCNIKTRKAMLSKFSDWLNCFNGELSRKRYWRGTEIPAGGGRGRLYLTLHCHRQNDACI